jgi:hypothetical protein
MSQAVVRNPRVLVPRPDRVRCIARTGFGWIDARLRSQGWLELLSPSALAVYVFLCLVADRSGTSWYRRDRIGHELGIQEGELRLALDRLYQLDLVAYRPFHRHASDGFHQVLALSEGGPPVPEELIFGLEDDEERP